jgi:hypothetical protein
MPAAPKPPPLDRVVAARRLAAGMSVDAVARACRRPVEAIRELAWDDGFRELVDGWGGLMALEPAALEERLRLLAHAVLEDGIGRGEAEVAIFVVREEIRKREAIATLAGSVGKLIVRDLARAEAERAAELDARGPGAGEADASGAAAVAECAPDRAGAETAPAQPAVPRAPVDPCDRIVWRAAATLRRRLFHEHLLWWRDGREREQAQRREAFEAARAAADAPPEAPSEPPPEPQRVAPALLASLLGDATEGSPPSPAPGSLGTSVLAGKLLARIVAQTPDPTPAFEESLAAALARLPRGKLEILATFDAAAVRRLMRMADDLPRAPAPTSAAVPEGP